MCIFSSGFTMRDMLQVATACITSYLKMEFGIGLNKSKYSSSSYSMVKLVLVS